MPAAPPPPRSLDEGPLPRPYEREKGLFLHKYRILLPQPLPDWQLEQLCFKNDLDEAARGLGKYEHFRRYADLLYPSLRWNPWLERMMRAFCNVDHVMESGGTRIRVVSLVGVAAAGKTFASGRYAFLWWLADAPSSIVILTSTTKTAIGQRVWPQIQSAFWEAKRGLSQLHGVPEDAVGVGNLLDSRKILQSSKGDDKHAIFAQAVKDGETSKAEAFIQGQHAKRILLVIDEANETPEAIFGVVANLRKACQDLTIIIIGNPISRLDPHGRCCMPRGGWGNRVPGSLEWATEGIPEWQIPPGLCLQFRGVDSPNVVAGRTQHPFIYTFEDYQASLREGVRNTLRYWRYDAGEWAPEGLCNTVFNETQAIACRVQEGVVFETFSEAISFCDPAFGGDDCIQMIGRIGDVKGGRLAIAVTHVIEIPVQAEMTGEDGKRLDAIHQIAGHIKANCALHKVKSRNFGIYATGTGSGIASVLFTDWSNEILRVEEGGRASDRPWSISDHRPACEVCDRRVTELWFSAKEFADARLLRGVDTATLIELCAREYEMTGKPARYRIETKEEFKPKLGHSPDRGDCLVGLCELAKVRHGALGGGDVKDDLGSSWQDVQHATQSVEANADYSDAKDAEEVAFVPGYGEDDLVY